MSASSTIERLRLVNERLVFLLGAMIAVSGSQCIEGVQVTPEMALQWIHDKGASAATHMLNGDMHSVAFIELIEQVKEEAGVMDNGH